MADKQRLGEMLLKASLINQQTLDNTLQLQTAGRRRLGYLLVRMGHITEDDLQETLSRQLNMPLINAGDLFDNKTKGLLPRSVCRQYTILPLRLAEHNILDLAMVDPSDEEAIRHVEQQTGRVVRANLARHSDIEEAITRLIPWSYRDFFVQQNRQKILWLALIALLALTVISLTKFNNTQNRLQFGIRKVTETGIEMTNHDLTIVFRNNGTTLLKGYGKHAEGSYNIAFNNLKSFKQFLSNKQNDFSQQQWNWLQRVIDNQNKNSR